MLKNNQKNIIIVISLVIVCLGLFFLAIKPSIEKLNDINSIVKKQKDKIYSLLERGQNIKKSIENLEIIEDKIYVLNNIMLKRGSELEFIKNLEIAAEKNNLSQNIKFDGETESTKLGLEIVPIKIQIEGSLEDVLGYLNALEQMNYYINIDKISLSKSEDKNYKQATPMAPDENEEDETTSIINETELNVQISAKTYWKK